MERNEFGKMWEQYYKIGEREKIWTNSSKQTNKIITKVFGKVEKESEGSGREGEKCVNSNFNDVRKKYIFIIQEKVTRYMK